MLQCSAQASKPPLSSHRLVCFLEANLSTSRSHDHVRESEDFRSTLSHPCPYPLEGAVLVSFSVCYMSGLASF